METVETSARTTGTGTDAPASPVRRWRPMVALALVVALVLAACGGEATDERLADPVSMTSPTSPTSPTSSPVTVAPPTTELAPPAAEPVSETTVPPTTAPETTVAPTTVPPTTVPPTELPEPAGVLEAGSVGTRTAALQQALRDQHYDPGEADGRFGLKTTMAVWAFQALHGLPKDGVVTPELEAVILARPAQDMLRPEHGPTHTEVDLTRQVMIVWRDGVPSLVTHVSTGSEVPYCEDTEVGRNCGDAVTPTGVYRYQRRIDGWRDAPLGRLYKPVYFNGGIAVHGASSVPTHPASHGCVRIPMDIAEYFPSLVADGEVIEVFRS